MFKYGHLFVQNLQTFVGDLKEHENDKHLFDLLTVQMNLFEYSFEYLIIHTETENYKGSSFDVQMNEVQNVFVFNLEAKKEMSISFDPRIQIHISPWTKWFDELQKNLFINQSMRGIDNLWHIFNLKEEEKKNAKELLKEML